MAATVLNGITWGHSRGLTPLLAASQRYTELHPHIEIRWTKRSLQEFADYPIEKLTEKYDLLIIDHPWVGCAAATNCVLPLDDYLSQNYLEDQARHSVGQSFESYFYGGHQWALAVDAATPAASFRKDLFNKHHVNVPQTWDELIDLARDGKVAVPAIPIDLLMNFYSFCFSGGGAPFKNEQEIIDQATGERAIETMLELYTLIDQQMFSANPIAVAELMSSTDDYWYCPFAYCYSNYSRGGYAKNLLDYGSVVCVNNAPLKTTIGGTGLAVSSFSSFKDIAVDLASYIASPGCQAGIYVQNGGQPGHLSAWENEEANLITHDFFNHLLPVMENGYMRPRYNGYLSFQDHAGLPLQQCLRQEIKPREALNQMNKLYQQSFKHKNPPVTI